MLQSRSFLSFFATLTLFTLLAGDALRYTLSWYGWGVVVAFIVAVSATLVWQRRGVLRLGAAPYPLVLFMLLATASVAWSFYPGASALGIAGQWVTTLGAFALALILDWAELLRFLGRAIKYILALSLLFELMVATVVRVPVLPLWVEYPDGKLPLQLFWSRNVLFDGGPIQGIVGNSSLLAFVALLGVIVFAVQFAARSAIDLPTHTTLRRHGVGMVFWLAVSALVVVLTRSATILLALVVLAIVVAVVWTMRRIRVGAPRTIAYVVFAAALAAVATVSLVGRDGILGLLGKSSDLTGRLGIWEAVVGLAEQRPVFGWGWVSYWAPWVAPFDTLEVRHGVLQLHAHNAWLDVWLQLGWVGMIVFAALVLSTLLRSWFLAVDGSLPRNHPGDSDAGLAPKPHPALSMLPLLLMVALLVQSVAESRLLVEYGWALLVFVAIRTKITPAAPADRPLTDTARRSA
ncbi:O-antigen ligase-like membrane protein [Homoserinimonas aerilata]|uniref:O-antigen ligase-like membrane protein n=1 Tax=Homoserinimonas aerilata TaxID=1162970 RepID=A0A542YKI5_9MICO|nr:O-antigen ligase family protein [Homoserinimonas aerilata]TQL48616.1 O-antigen ligase-like membrane protein [Homoserinimonas aerilata]